MLAWVLLALAAAHGDDHDDTTMVGAATGSQAYRCGGQLKATSWTDWSTTGTFGTSGLQADVDTSGCHFAGDDDDAEPPPNYVASVQGDYAHWQLIGSNAVYAATATGFTLYLWHPTLRGAYLQYFAQRYNWQVNWAAQTDAKSGITHAGKSGWQQDARHTRMLHIDVDTTASGFDAAPAYVISLHGKDGHCRAHGSHSVYSATATGFRVYIWYPSETGPNIDPVYAETHEWQIAYIGSDAAPSTTAWQASDSGSATAAAPAALFIDVAAAAPDSAIFIPSLSAGSGSAQ